MKIIKYKILIFTQRFRNHFCKFLWQNIGWCHHTSITLSALEWLAKEAKDKEQLMQYVKGALNVWQQY